VLCLHDFSHSSLATGVHLSPYLLSIHDYLTTALLHRSMPLMFRGNRLAGPALIQPYYISYVYCSLILVTEKLYTALLSLTHYSMMYCFFPLYIRALENDASHCKVAIYTKESVVVKLRVELFSRCFLYILNT
jgi:hypothetical protein